ncbi:MAG: nucleoside-diphosphate kinase [Nitrospirota bacterium]
MERTLAIVKPDAVSKNVVGEIIKRFEAASLKVVALQMKTLSQEEAKVFYGVHSHRPFFNGLIDFICSGPIVPMVLEGEGAILKARTLMGATDPAKAEKGTIRHDLGDHIEANAVHGSDSPETAAFEVPLFFPCLV